MILRAISHRPNVPYIRLAQMTSHISNGASSSATTSNGKFPGVSLRDLPKSNTFTVNLPTDPKFKNPADSYRAPRDELGPRMVKGALYTYVRPEESKDPELLGVSNMAMSDIGLKDGEENTEEFKSMVAGNRIFWNEDREEGIYPWAQCYGGTEGEIVHH